MGSSSPRAAKRTMSAALVIGSTVAVLASPLSLGTASAATTISGIVSGANSNVRANGTSTAPQTFAPAKVVVGYSGTAAIDYTVTSGPDTSSPNLSSSGTCTPNTPLAGQAQCTIANSGGIGADQVIIFADNDASGGFSSGDASVTTTVTYSNKPNQVAINPVRSPAAHAVTTEANTCEVFKVQAFDSVPEPAGARRIVLTAAESLPDTNPGAPFSFFSVDSHGNCTTTIAPQSVSHTPDNGTTRTESAATFVDTGNDGTAEIGLASSKAGTGSLTAVPFDVASGVSDVDNITWGAGGPDSVASLKVSPASSTGYTGTTASYTLTATDSGGNPVQGVNVNAQETSGPGATSNCANPTDQNGNVTCSIINGGSAGTVNETFWVNYDVNLICPGGDTTNADSCEPQAVASATFDAIPAYTTTTLTCVQQLNNGQQGQAVTSCGVPLSQHDIAFTETLKNNGTPVQGAIITFTGTGTLGGSAASPTGTATTDANGVATFTVTDSAPQNGDFVSVSSKIGNSGLSGPTTGTWYTPVASSLAVTPAVQSVTKGGAVSVNVKIVDQFGSGVAAANSLSYVVSGRNNGRNGVVTTGSDGSASISYTDAGTNSGATSDTIAVTDTTNPLTGSATVEYLNGTTTTATIAVDTSGSGISDGTCNASGHTAATNVSFTHQTEVCAVVKNAANEALAGKSVVITVSNGQVAAHGALSSASTTSYTATTDANGVAFADVTSTKTGAQTVTASADSVNGTGTVTYAAPAAATARNIAVSPASGNVTAGTQQKYTFTVTDQYGNGVPGVSVLATQSGSGILTGGNTTVITGTDGTASVQLATQATDTGTGSVTGSISAGGNQCGFAAGNPAGSTAGNCTAVATYTIAAPVVPNSVTILVAPGGKVGTTELIAAAVKNSDGTPAVNQLVRYTISGANNASGATVTNSKGNALFGFKATKAGTSTVTAYVDINDDQVRESSEPQGSGSVTIAKSVEKPTIRLTSAHGTVTIHVTSHPSLSHATVTYYVKHKGNFTKIGVGKTGSAGHASQTFVESKGVTYTFRAKVSGKSGVKSGVSTSKSIKVKS